MKGYNEILSAEDSGLPPNDFCGLWLKGRGWELRCCEEDLCAPWGRAGRERGNRDAGICGQSVKGAREHECCNSGALSNDSSRNV